jgi:hypothetical protein
MCLTEILPMPEEFKKDKTFYGFKILLKYPGKGYDGVYLSPIYKYNVLFNEWMIDNNCRDIMCDFNLLTGEKTFYGSGFHICLTKEDLSIWASKYLIGCNSEKDFYKIFPVLFTDVVCYGKQGDINVVVARQIYVENKE